jgi:hypothetical protein
MNLTDPQLFDKIWDSLKIVITAIAILSPFVIVYLLVRIKRIKRDKKSLSDQHQANQKLLEKRVEIYEHMGPRLNDLLCFYSYTGNWKELTPMRIMGIKRELDKHMSSQGALFSDELIAGYNALMQVCFVAFSGWEQEEKIKSQYTLRQEQQTNWDESWIPYFDTNNVLDGTVVKTRYDELMSCFKKELNP